MDSAPHTTARPAVVSAALAYAARGWHIFPLRAGDKRPAIPTHPASRCDGTDPWCRNGHTGWQDRATPDPERITRCWTRRPGAGIGIACGPSRLVVVDLDTPKPGSALPPEWDLPGVHDGADVLAVLADRADRPYPTDTHTVRTPSGGTHLYFTAPTSDPVRNTASALGPLIDTRAHGGYVVAPPTTTTAGTYTTVLDVAPAPLPAWLHTALTTPTTRPTPTSNRSTGPGSAGNLTGYVTAALRAETNRVRTATPGTRNHALFLAAVALGQIVGAGALSAGHVTTALTDAATDHLNTGAYTPAEAAATIRSGLTRGTAEPRTLPSTLPTRHAA